MRPSRLLVAVGVVCVWGCSTHTSVVPPPPAPNLQPRLDAADRLVAIGCFDCLLEAFREYNLIRGVPAAPQPAVDAATRGAVRAAALLELHERELGMADDGYLQRARDLIGSNDAAGASVGGALDVVADVPSRIASAPIASAPALTPQSFRDLQAKRQQQAESLKVGADADPLSAYLWLAFSCADPFARVDAQALMPPLVTFRDAPFVVYRAATCVRTDAKTLGALLEREPRFTEIEFWLGAAAIGARQLDEAEAHFRKAYDWHPRWPAAATSLGNLYMTAEEPQTALDFYDRALALAPEHGEALIGRVRALSHLARHDEAFVTIDRIIAGKRWFEGEAIYWRAWNELQAGRVEEAWASVGRAEALWAVGQVSKLAGLIAMRRQQLEVARGKFEMGRRQAPDDCEMQFLLGTVHAELRSWAPTAAVFISTAACVQDAQRELTTQISKIQASNRPPERKARLIARAEQKIKEADRMLATSWFNTAAAYYNLSKTTEAREYAQKVSADPQFGERARDLLSRLEKQ